MTFTASNNSVVIKNSAGTVIFDTDRKMPAVTSIASGSISIPSRGGTGQTATMHYLGAANGNPEFVLGSAIITGATSYPWVNTMINSSGSTLTNLGWNYTDTWRIAGARAITFEVISNALYLREEYYNQFPSLQLASFNLEYKVYLGRYV